MQEWDHAYMLDLTNQINYTLGFDGYYFVQSFI